MANDLPTPVTNPEKFAAKAAGMDIETPTPVTNLETYLDAIAKGGGVSPEEAYTKAQTDALLAGKVDKVDGKDLSTEDFTAAEKAKLSGIAAGAEVNVQSDWNQTDTDADDYIKNKPTIPAEQVSSDWSAASGVAQILNKPTLGTAAAADTTTSITSGGTGLPTSGTVYESQAAQDALISGLTGELSMPEIKNTSVFSYIDTLPVGMHWFYNEANQSVTDTPESINSTVYYSVYKSSSNTTEVVAYMPSVNYNNKTYTCSKTSGVWHEWIGFDNVYGYGRALTSGTDLNTITTPGKYVSGTTSIANSLVNKPPYDNPGSKTSMYEVEPFSSIGLIQKCFVFKSGTGTDRGTPEMYIRTGTYANDTWTWYDWYSVSLTAATS